MSGGVGDVPPSSQLLRPPRWWAAVAVGLLGALLINLDRAAVLIANPSIADSLGASLADLQWVANAYLLPLTVLLVAGGALADRFDRGKMLLLGLALFCLGSVGSALSHTIEVLISMRVVEGVGAALVLPATIAVIRAAVSGRRLALALGFWVAGATAGAAVGPLIGGVLLAALSWRAIFWPNVAIGILSMGVVVMVLRGTATASRRSSLHVGWNLVIALGLTGVVWGLIGAGSSGWASERVLLVLAVGFALLVAVSLRVRAAVGRRGRKGMDIRFLLGVLSMTVLFLFGMVGTFFLLVIYLQRVQGFSPLETGMLVLPFTAVAALFAPVVGWAMSRVGRRAMLLTGFGLELAALAGLSRLGTSSSYHDVWPFLLLLGLGAATIPTVTLDLVMARAREARAGMFRGSRSRRFTWVT